MPYPPVEIVVGPYFVSAPMAQRRAPQVASIDAVMEFATQQGSSKIPLFRKICSQRPDKCDLDEILIHSDDIPCDVEYRPFYAASSPEGTFVPLDAVLAAMFRDFRINRTPREVLADLCETVHPGFAWRRRGGLLTDTFERRGYGVSMIDAYGRSVKAVLCWSPPTEREKAEEGAVLVAWMDFRPQADGTLGEGVWKEPWKEHLSNVLYHEFRKNLAFKPVEVLSESGKEQLLADFEWTPLARMTAKQARAARIKFICENAALKSNPRSLAEALRNAGLYAASTSVHQVLKFIPSLIAESEIESH